MITAEQIKAIAPFAKQSDIQAYVPHLNKYMPLVHIDTVPRMAAFIAQLLHESGGLHFLEEIASGKAYEGRKDLGNTFPGDGVKFKGRGPIQITGRSNYHLLSIALFVDDRLLNHPEQVATYETGTRAACWFWDTHKLNWFADQSDSWRSDPLDPKSDNKFMHITRMINGGLNGYADRLQYYTRALKILQ